MKASDHVADFLHAQGVTHVFEVIGGMITHLIDSVHRRGKVKLVNVHHEQAAAFAAEAMGRATGVPGVAMATSGPGAVNLLTGIGSCYFDSTPAVFITGQVNLHEQKGRRSIRQLGFQETDIAAMAVPITKAVYRVRSSKSLPGVLRKAFRTALSGRPGPVLIDLPMDLQREEIPPPKKGRVRALKSLLVDTAAVGRLLSALERAERPLILVGGGVRSSRALEAAREWLSRTGVPVVNSLMAVDALPVDHPLRVGLIGSYGNRWANHALGRCDVLVVIGSRLDVRQTGADTKSFGSGRVIFHVDCDPGEMNNRIRNCHAIRADLGQFFQAAAGLGRRFPSYAAWRAEIDSLRQGWPDTAEPGRISGINPNAFMHALSKFSGKAGSFITDVGQHQMWAAQSLDLSARQRFMTSGGMGAMGFGLPAAIGAAFADPGRPQVLISGDGGTQLNIQELQTVVRNRLPLKIVILNNGCHGMVRQFQQTYFHERYASTMWGYSAPDFTAVAKAYGLSAARISRSGDVVRGLAALWRHPNKPFLLEVMIDPETNVYPKIAFGRPLTEMEPMAKPIAMEGT